MDKATKIDNLLDAIELVKADQREEASHLLRQLIREDSNFEHAWLWMSVAVDTFDQSVVCLDNVLRINPANTEAAGALYRLRKSEIAMERQRTRFRFIRDLTLGSMWILFITLLYAALLTYNAML